MTGIIVLVILQKRKLQFRKKNETKNPQEVITRKGRKAVGVEPDDNEDDDSGGE